MSRPRSVKRAIVADNSEALSSMGKKGAEATNKLLAERRETREYFEQRDELRRKEEANEHILPIEPEEEEAV